MADWPSAACRSMCAIRREQHAGVARRQPVESGTGRDRAGLQAMSTMPQTRFCCMEWKWHIFRTFAADRGLHRSVGRISGGRRLLLFLRNVKEFVGSMARPLIAREKRSWLMIRRNTALAFPAAMLFLIALGGRCPVEWRRPKAISACRIWMDTRTACRTTVENGSW